MHCLSQMSVMAVKGKVNKQTKNEILPTTKLVCIGYGQNWKAFGFRTSNPSLSGFVSNRWLPLGCRCSGRVNKYNTINTAQAINTGDMITFHWKPAPQRHH